LLLNGVTPNQEAIVMERRAMAYLDTDDHLPNADDRHDKQGSRR
jgi:hypothetical protein